MNKVLLDDVAVEHKETCKGSKDSYPIVGLGAPYPGRNYADRLGRRQRKHLH